VCNFTRHVSLPVSPPRQPRPWNRVLAALPALLAACGVGGAPPRETLQHGPFEIVAEGRRVSAGGFPNTSGNPLQSIEVTSFTVRHQGRPVVVQHGSSRSDRFWTVLRLPDAPRPALLVATTNVHLLTAENGQVVVRHFDPEPGTDTVSLQWLDQHAGQPGAVLQFGIRRTAGADTLLQGGRWLRGKRAVLDVQTLELLPFDGWLDRAEGAAQPLAGLNAMNGPALAFSPQRSAFAALGSDDANRLGLLVVDFKHNRRHAVPIDRHATRLRQPADATPAWLDHHFAWVRDAQGADRLQPRPHPGHWPWQGQWLPSGGEHLEYRIGPLGAAGLAAMRNWLDTAYAGGQWVADPAPLGPQPRQVWQPPGSGVRLQVSLGQGHVSVYEAVALGAAYSAQAREWVERVGRAWDAELRSGRHDALFEASR
jgi:hypothetical protein